MKARTTTWFCALFLIVAMLAEAAAEPKRVLFLHSFGRAFSPYSAHFTKLRTELARQSPEPIDIYEASLETARFADGERDAPFIEYLNSLFAGRQLDLVITIGAPAAGFVQRHRQRLFPSTPALFTAVEQRLLNDIAVTPNDATVTLKIEIPALVESMLAVLPRTTHIAVVVGNSPLEKFWLEEMRREFQRFANRISFTWFNELPLDEMLRRSTELPPRSAIFLGPFSVDAAGVPHEEDSAFAAIYAVSNAPMFSYTDVHFGRGLVGGPMISMGALSRQSAAAAVRILRGEPPESVKTPVIGFAAPLYDARELRRWDISEASLQPGSIVQFREPSIWEQYKWYIAAAIAIVVLQAILILVLFTSSRRLRRAHSERRQAEKAAQEFSARLIKAQEEERSRLARELHDDVTQRLASLAIDAGREERRLLSPADGSTIRAMREGLVRLSEDVHALSYRLHPSILEDLGLVEALKSECERFSRTSPVRLETNLQDVPDNVPQDVALCLFRIAQEGLRNIARHAQATRAGIWLRPLDDGLQLIVKDNGVGFDPETHRPGASLGHAGMRQRVFFLAGTIEIDSSFGHGTMIAAWVPLKGEHREPTARAAG